MFSLLPLAVVAHCVLLYGMFDVYFKSPIVADLPPVPSTFTTPAKRLVLFVGDGLRADHFFDTNHVPFLQNRIQKGEAVFGISHTRVPTESRPGTVALAAGVYEDPAAVFRGWQDYPVPFDTFFNRCFHTFAWGSPDIVHLFSKLSNKVEARSYEEEQRFDPNVSLSLNQWVLTEFISFVDQCQRNSTCRNILHSDKISFFFHFIGIDMSGHESKPFSNSYVDNIRQVDGIVEQIAAIFDDIFQDDKTSFVFTSDHGMTNWGSHGDGSKDETKTPLIVWGSGVKYTPCSPIDDNFRLTSWGVSHCMVDVNQADIAVLMPTLLGVEIPSNSMGTLPTKYLNFDDDTLISALMLNAKQLHVLYEHLENDIKQQIWRFFFRPYTVQSDDGRTSMKTVEDLNYLKKSDRDTAERILLLYISQLKAGINYYQTYYQNYLLFLLTISYLGLIAAILGKLYQTSCGPLSKRWERRKRPTAYRLGNINLTKVDVNFLGVFALVSIVHIFHQLPFTYYVYSVLPVALWWMAFDYLWFSNLSTDLLNIKITKCAKGVCWFIIGIELVFLSFFYRLLLSIVMVVLGALPIDTPVAARSYSTLWTVTRLALAVFPLLPPVGMEKHTFIVIFSGMLMWVVIHALTKTLIQDTTFLSKIQTVLLIVAMTNMIYIDICYSYNIGLTVFAQLLSWTILVINFAALFFLPSNPLARLINVVFALSIPFLMLSISYESMFLPTLSLFMGNWLRVICPDASDRTGNIIEVPKRSFANESRIGFLYLFLAVFSFFGIGNIDSLSSFDIIWVRCFVQVFSPFTMTALIVLKILMPFFLVASFLRLIVSRSKASPVTILLVTLVLCEVMGLQFLFAVQNEGSWLDIGKSISHYVIMKISSFSLVVLYVLSGYIVEPKSKNVFC